MIKIQETVTTTKVTVHVNGAGIVQLLKDFKVIPYEAIDVSITFAVPSGGNYSGMNIDLEDEIVEVKYSLVKSDEIQYKTISTN